MNRPEYVTPESAYWAKRNRAERWQEERAERAQEMDR